MSVNSSSSNFVEGEGTFKDFNGSEDGTPVFQTTNKDEWDQYCIKNKITRSGTEACIRCNKVITIDNLPAGKNAVCDECKEELLS